MGHRIPDPKNHSSPDSRSSIPSSFGLRADCRGETPKSSAPPSHAVQASINIVRPSSVISIVALSVSYRMFITRRSSRSASTINRMFVNARLREQLAKVSLRCAGRVSSRSSFSASSMGEPLSTLSWKRQRLCFETPILPRWTHKSTLRFENCGLTIFALRHDARDPSAMNEQRNRAARLRFDFRSRRIRRSGACRWFVGSIASIVERPYAHAGVPLTRNWHILVAIKPS